MNFADAAKQFGGTPSGKPPVQTPAVATPGTGSFADAAKQFGGTVSDKPNVSANVPVTSSDPGFVQGLAQDLAHPFLRLGATVRQAGDQTQDILHDLGVASPLEPKEKQMLFDQTYDMGWFGKVKSIQNPWDAMGVGAQAGSWFTPVGETAKLADGAALQLAKTPFWSKAVKFMKEALPFAASQGVGVGMEKLGEGKGAGEAAMDATTNIIGNLGGYGLFKGGMNILKFAGSRILQSDIAKEANKYVLDLANKAFHLDPKFGNNMSPESAQKMMGALNQQYEKAHSQAVNAVGDALKLPTTWNDVYQGLQRKVSEFFTGLVDAKTAKYGKVMNDENTIYNLQPVHDALDRARKWLGGVNTDMAGMTSQEKMKMLQNAGTTGIGNGESALEAYMQKVQSLIGTADKTTPISTKTLDQLYMAGGHAQGAENKYIQDISTSLFQAAREDLMKQGKGDLVKLWDEAHSDWQNVNGMMGTRIASSLKNVGDSKAFVERIFGSKPSAYSEKMLQGLPEDMKSQLSDLVFNHVVDQAQKDKNGGAGLQKFLDNWSGKGLLTPQHEAMLQEFSHLVNSTYNEFSDGMMQMMGKGAEGADKAAQKAFETQGDAAAAEKVAKAVGDKPLYKLNEDGTYDFSRLSSVVEKLNTEGQYDDVVKSLSAIKDITTMKSSIGPKLRGAFEGIFGAFMIGSGHPVIGGGAILTAIKHVFQKEVKGVTAKDLANMTTTLIKQGKMTPSIMTNLITGQYDKAASLILKPMMAESGNKLTPNDVPTDMPSWFSDEFKARTGQDASPDVWNEFRSSVGQ